MEPEDIDWDTTEEDEIEAFIGELLGCEELDTESFKEKFPWSNYVIENDLYDCMSFAEYCEEGRFQF